VPRLLRHTFRYYDDGGDFHGACKKQLKAERAHQNLDANCRRSCPIHKGYKMSTVHADACENGKVHFASTTAYTILSQTASNVRHIVMHAGRDAPAIFSHIAERKESHSLGVHVDFFMRWLSWIINCAKKCEN
jgi:hypothetical protein